MECLSVIGAFAGVVAAIASVLGVLLMRKYYKQNQLEKYSDFEKQADLIADKKYKQELLLKAKEIVQEAYSTKEKEFLACRKYLYTLSGDKGVLYDADNFEKELFLRLDRGIDNKISDLKTSDKKLYDMVIEISEELRIRLRDFLACAMSIANSETDEEKADNLKLTMKAMESYQNAYMGFINLN